MYDTRDVILAFIVVAMACFQLDALGIFYHIEALASMSTIIGGMCFGSLLMLVYFNEAPKATK